MKSDELIEQMLKEPDQHAEVVTDKSLDKQSERLPASVENVPNIWGKILPPKN